MERLLLAWFLFVGYFLVNTSAVGASGYGQIPCVLRVYYQTGLELGFETVEKEFEDAHSIVGVTLVMQTFSAPFPTRLPLDNYYQTRGHLHYLWDCELVIIYHYSHVDKIVPLLDLKSMRNSHLLWPPEDSIRDRSAVFQTESVNIIALPFQHAQTFHLPSTMKGIVRKTARSRGDPLRHRHLRVSFYDLKPHYYHANGKTVGIAYEMVDAASKWYNFSYTSFLDPAIVTRDENGELRGMENEVIHGRIDMNFLYAPTFLPPGANVEASTYYSPASIVFLAKLPVLSRINWTAILHAFELNLWLVTLLTCLVFGVTVYAKIKVSSSDARSDHWAPARSFYIVFNGLLGQEIQSIPKSCRSLAILWLLSSFVLTNYYCSNLLALLTYPEMERVPKDMVDLALREDYKVVAIELPGGSMEQYFNKSTSWELANIWKRASFLPMVQCATEAMITSKQVCIGWDFMTEGFLQTNATINEFFYPAFKSHNPPITVFTCGVLQKNSPYTDGINEVVGWSRDSGLYHKWLHESQRLAKHVGKSWRTSEGQKNSRITKQLVEIFRTTFKGGTAEAFKLVNLRTPFILLAGGCGLGVIAWACEISLFLICLHKLLSSLIALKNL